MKVRNDQTRAEERERISRAIGRLARAVDGKWGFGELPFKVELSAARRDALVSAARGYKARGLPVSAALLLMASSDPDAIEVARSREHREAFDLIEARHDVAALATHHSTWQHEFPKGQWQRMSSAGLNGAQLSFIRDAPQDGEAYDISQLANMLRRLRFHGDQVARQQIKACYVALLLLAQAPETCQLDPRWLRATLNLDVLHKVVRLNLNHYAPGLSWSGGYKGARAGIFNVRFEMPEQALRPGGLPSLKQKRQLVARGAHRTSSTYIHLNAAHVEEIAALVDATQGSPT